MLSPLAGGSSVSYTYPSNTLSADISDLLPFSNYSATLQSSNIAGTSNSSDASTIITGEIGMYYCSVFDVQCNFYLLLYALNVLH